MPTGPRAQGRDADEGMRADGSGDGPRAFGGESLLRGWLDWKLDGSSVREESGCVLKVSRSSGLRTHSHRPLFA